VTSTSQIFRRQRLDVELLRSAAAAVRAADLELATLLAVVAKRVAVGKCVAGDPLRVAAVAVAAKLTTTEVRQ